MADSFSACSSRASPAFSRDSLLPFGSSSPGSPNSRSRSGSMGQDDFSQMRPRCYSFHMNSEGRASRVPRNLSLYPEERISPDDRLNPEMRRGSVGASFGPYIRRKSPLADRSSDYLPKFSDNFLSPERKVQRAPATETVMESPLLRIPVPIAPGGVWQNRPPSGQLKSSFKPISPREESMESSHQPGSPMMVDEGDSKNENKDEEVPIFHKKFDKLRRHNIAINDEDKSRPTSPQTNMAVETISEEQADKQEKSMPKKTEKPKKTTIEAHPQLFAHLNSPVSLSKPYNPFMANQRGKEQLLLKVPQVKNSVQKSPFNDPVILPKNQQEDVERDLHQSTMLHLKDKLLRKYDSMENLSKIDQNHGQNDSSENRQINGGHTDKRSSFPVGHLMNPQQSMGYPQVFPSGMPMHPAFMGAAYNSIQAMNLLPAYNQHLAGMQQLAQFCANGQTIVRPEGEGHNALNLSCPQQSVATDNHSVTFEELLDKKIKEEINSS